MADLKQNRQMHRITIPQLMERMIAYSDGSVHDIDHLIKVWTYARTIGELEGLDEETQYILEAAAILHDIACPLCREKYGNTNGKHQEEEGMILAEEFLRDTGMSGDEIERVRYLIGHHHTLSDIHEMDYQILIEADYIVNASEKGFSRENVDLFIQKIMRTASGKRLAAEVLKRAPESGSDAPGHPMTDTTRGYLRAIGVRVDESCIGASEEERRAAAEARIAAEDAHLSEFAEGLREAQEAMRLEE